MLGSLGLDLGLVWGSEPEGGLIGLDLDCFGPMLESMGLDLGLFWGSGTGFGPILGDGR